MEGLREARESMKNDINQLKDQFGQILEPLTTLQSIVKAQNEASHSAYLHTGQRNRTE